MNHTVQVARVIFFFALLGACTTAYAQTPTTYYLHREFSGVTMGAFHLQPNPPDSPALVRTSGNMKGRPPHVQSFGWWETGQGIPGMAGVIPAGSVLSFTLWMRKTTNRGNVFPYASAKLNDGFGAFLCSATGGSEVTTTLAPHSFSCTTTESVSMTTIDRLVVFPGYSLTVSPGNHNMEINFHLEGTSHSAVTIPAATIDTPALTGVSPTSVVVGQDFVITGVGFGSSQASATVTIGGQPASVATWSDSAITASAPPGASSGPVVVTVAGHGSNSVPLTVSTTANRVRVTGYRQPGGATYSYQIENRSDRSVVGFHVGGGLTTGACHLTSVPLGFNVASGIAPGSATTPTGWSADAFSDESSGTVCVTFMADGSEPTWDVPADGSATGFSVTAGELDGAYLSSDVTVIFDDGSAEQSWVEQVEPPMW